MVITAIVKKKALMTMKQSMGVAYMAFQMKRIISSDHHYSK